MREDLPTLPMPAQAMRSLIEERLDTCGISFARLSKSVGKNSSYMHHFLKRGTPRYLDEADRAVVANLLGIEEALLAPPGSTRAMTGAAAPSATAISLARFAPKKEPTGDVPTFHQFDDLDPKGAVEWLPRSLRSAGEMIAVRMETGSGRIEPGDTVFMARQPARIGDTVFTVRDRRLGPWGRMTHRTSTSVTVAGSDGEQTVEVTGGELLRLIAIVTI